MAVVQTTCDRCGEIRVSVHEVIVYPGANEMRLSCPVCRRGLVKPVSEGVLRELLDHGAELRAVSPAITLDDIIAFHESFEDEMRELLR